MHEVENLSGELGSSVPCTLQQTQTQEGKGEKTLTWASHGFFWRWRINSPLHFPLVPANTSGICIGNVIEGNNSCLEEPGWGPHGGEAEQGGQGGLFLCAGCGEGKERPESLRNTRPCSP